MKMELSDLACSHTLHNHDEILRSVRCGCFSCRRSFLAHSVTEWVNEEDGSSVWGEDADGSSTAVCPYCGLDYVIGDASGFEISDRFLKRMNIYIFG